MAFTSTSKLISTLLLLASFTSKSAGQQTCSLCPPGSSIEDEAGDILGFGTSICSDNEASINSFVLLASACDDLVQDAFLATIDLPAFCCSNVDPQEGLCSLCEEGSSLINPDFLVGAYTCSDISTASPFITNATLCEQFQFARPFCCSGGASTCQLCPNGGEIAFPDKAIPFLEGLGVTTCDGLADVVGMIPEAECGATLEDIGSDISFAALCGCTDVTPPVICDLCGNGELIDPDLVIFDGDGTCGEFVGVAPYAATAEGCTDLVDGGRAACCTSPVATEAPVAATEAPVAATEAPVAATEAPVTPTEAPVTPTESPVAAPTDDSSAPASKFIVALTSSMLMVGTMMMIMLA
jgi:cell division septation protein DedD